MSKGLEKRIRNQIKEKSRGITLIALVITIIVLLILAGVSIATLTGDNGLLTKAQQAKDANERAEQKDYDSLANYEALINDFGNSQYNEEKQVNSPKLSEGMIPIKYNGTNWVITNENDREWYDYIGDKKWANVMLSDGTYKTSAKNYATDGTTVVSEADLGSMFVWVPRFAYSITEYKVEKKNTEGTTANITDITFLKGTTLQDNDGNFYETDYTVDQVQVGQATPKIVHPAFKFDGQNVAGLWVAKFEASMAESNNNTNANNNVTNKTMKIKPNAESWRYIQVGNMFTNCLILKNGSVYELNNAVDSHLMKNNEWGAVSYLATSQYGSVPTTNTSGASYTEDSTTKYHSYTGNQDYKTNKNQSTTGNETGIYDLNGGAWEYVAAYWDNTNGNLSGQETATYFQGNKLKEEYAKYWDKYEVSQTEITEMNNELWSKGPEANSIRKAISTDRYNLMKNIKGDAMYEAFNTFSYYGKKIDKNYDWIMDETTDTVQYARTYYNDDYTLIGNTARPFLLRGGDWGGGTGAGVFASSGDDGNATGYRGFRPVLVR